MFQTVVSIRALRVSGLEGFTFMNMILDYVTLVEDLFLRECTMEAKRAFGVENIRFFQQVGY